MSKKHTYTFHVLRQDNDRRKDYQTVECDVVVKAENLYDAENKAKALAGYKHYESCINWEVKLTRVEE